MGERSEGDDRSSFHGKLARPLAYAVAGLLALTAGALTGCNSDRITGPRPELTTAKHKTADLVIGDTDNFPVSSSEINCSNGEEVPYSGHMTIGVFTTTSGNFHLLFSTHTTVDGTGSFGNVYHGASDDVFELNDPSTLGFEETLVHNVTMKSNTAPDMRVKILAHVTVSATGQWTAYVDTAKMECDAPSAI